MSKTDWSQYEVKESPATDWSQYEVAPTTGIRGVASDFSNSLNEFGEDAYNLLSDPSRLYDLAKNLTNEAGQGIQQFTGQGPRDLPFQSGNAQLNAPEPMRGAKNALAGLASGIHGVASTPGNIADYLERKELLSPGISKTLIPRPQEKRNYSEELGLGTERGGDRFIRQVTELLPSIVAGERGLGAAGFLRKIGQRSGALAQHAAGQNEDPIKAALAGLIPAVPGAARAAGEATGRALRGTGNLFDKLSPSTLAAKYTPDIPTNELMRNVRASEGIQTPLGDVVGSPYLKKTFENTVAPMLGSGADDIFTKIAQDINARGEDIIGRMSTNPANSDPNTITKDLLVEARQAATAIKNNLWNTASQTAESEGFNLTLPTFDRFIAEHRSAIQNAPLLSENPEAQKMYRAVSRYANNVRNTPESQSLSSILGPQGSPIVSETTPATTTYPSIREAKILAGMLDDEAQGLSASSAGKDRAARALYSQMANSLRNDVQQAVMERGSPELQSQFSQANDYHANTFSNFLDRDIFPLTNENKSGQKIVRQIIKPSAKNDEYEAIQKVNNLLPENQQEVLGFSYLLDAIDKEGNINPTKVGTLINQLGPRQFQYLFQPETQQRLLDFMLLTRMNKEPINRFFNPHTGQRNQDMLKMIMNAISSITAATAGASAGGIPGALAGAVLGPAAISLGANILTKRLTSEPFRNEVVGKKIRRRAEQHRRED